MQEKLKENGFIQKVISVPNAIEAYIKEQNWEGLDEWLARELKESGLIFQEISRYINIKKTEHIISLRSAGEDEDGIWHDDGSREMAFTLSLTKENIEGGILQLRKKNGHDIKEIPTPSFGVLTIFLTGVHGFEHRVLKVISGRRIICAGWIN